MRETTYTLDKILQETPDSDRKAIITSSYGVSEKTKGDWPIPYSGRARMKGILGFLRGYEILSIEGSGRQVFNIDKEMIEEDQLEYKVKMGASLAWPLPGTEPNLNIDQKMTIKLLEN